MDAIRELIEERISTATLEEKLDIFVNIKNTSTWSRPFVWGTGRLFIYSSSCPILPK